MSKVYEFEALIHPVRTRVELMSSFPMIYEKSLARGG